MQRLSRLELGYLRVTDGEGTSELGRENGSEISATMRVNDLRFYRSVVLGGGLGAAAAYIRGAWETPDLTAWMRLLARNQAVLAGSEQGLPQLLKPARWLAHWLRRNTRAGSRRNISAHYDLSNEFFALMLDPTMTYSCGCFASPTSTMESASIEKYDRICRKLQLQPQDHILEIGTGWGGFAEHAARHYGCRVTTTTISEEQHSYAASRFRREALQDRITLLKDDYRDLRGHYDKLVSIEMIEAVGERFLPQFFRKCSSLLKSDGMMLLQAITIPDHRYDAYRRSVDFIQQYIFPGGFLPSMRAMAESVGRGTDLRFFHHEEFGAHYARTLAEWRRNFWNRIEQVRSQGFDEQFIRTWHYYLCYCEAGFHERQIGVSQLLLTKPDCRREPIFEQE